MGVNHQLKIDEISDFLFCRGKADDTVEESILPRDFLPAVVSCCSADSWKMPLQRGRRVAYDARQRKK